MALCANLFVVYGFKFCYAAYAHDLCQLVGIFGFHLLNGGQGSVNSCFTFWCSNYFLGKAFFSSRSTAATFAFLNMLEQTLQFLRLHVTPQDLLGFL